MAIMHDGQSRQFGVCVGDSRKSGGAKLSSGRMSLRRKEKGRRRVYIEHVFFPSSLPVRLSVPKDKEPDNGLPFIGIPMEENSAAVRSLTLCPGRISLSPGLPPEHN